SLPSTGASVLVTETSSHLCLVPAANLLHLRLGGHLLPRSARDEGIRVVDLFPWMGNSRRQLAGTLSGGEQQMLSIGRALVTQPRLLVIVEQHATLAMEFAHPVVSMDQV